MHPNKWLALRAMLKQVDLDVLLLENPVDLFYLTGLSLSKGSLVVKETELKLFVDSRYFAAAKRSCPYAVWLREQSALTECLQGKVGFDSLWTSYDQYSRLKQDASFAKWVPLAAPLKEMRARKEPDELAALRRAACLTKEGIAHIEQMLREGISEEELAWAFESFCRSRGASGLSFEPIIAFGEHSAYPHYRAGKTLLQKGQIVLMDVGAIVDHYRGDMTRVAFFGEVDPRIELLYDLVHKAFHRALEAVRPGVRIGLLDEIVREEFRKEGKEELYLHSLGHGIGLETHEYPRVRAKGEDAEKLLEPGMVITIEPGLYQPGLGGIRHEEMVIVTQQGYEIC